jgi:MFS family permease
MKIDNCKLDFQTTFNLHKNLCTLLLGIGLGAAQPNIMSLVHARSPAGRVGEALGLRSTIINSSQVVLPLVFGVFGSALGAGAMFWSMALIVGVGGGAAVGWRKAEQ